MYARWGSFAVGLGLILAPLVLGYREVASILHAVAIGLLVCIATLAAIEWPVARFALVAPALWLLWTGRAGGGTTAERLAGLAAGALLLVLTLVPGGRPAPRMTGRTRAGVRA
jgi:hypothetical protein